MHIQLRGTVFTSLWTTWNYWVCFCLGQLGERALSFAGGRIVFQHEYSLRKTAWDEFCNNDILTKNKGQNESTWSKKEKGNPKGKDKARYMMTHYPPQIWLQAHPTWWQIRILRKFYLQNCTIPLHNRKGTKELNFSPSYNILWPCDLGTVLQYQQLQAGIMQPASLISLMKMKCKHLISL